MTTSGGGCTHIYRERESSSAITNHSGGASCADVTAAGTGPENKTIFYEKGVSCLCVRRARGNALNYCYESATRRGVKPS
jgi:hypothetical protein